MRGRATAPTPVKPTGLAGSRREESCSGIFAGSSSTIDAGAAAGRAPGGRRFRRRRRGLFLRLRFSRFTDQVADLNRGVQRLQEIPPIDRLLDEIVGPIPERADGEIAFMMPGNENRRDAGPQRLNVVQQ